MFWVIVLGLTLPGPNGKPVTAPVTAPVMVPPAVAFVAEPQCIAAMKAIQAETGGNAHLGCARVSVFAKGAESF